MLLIRDLHLCPELAVVLQVTLNLAREVVLSVEVVHVQNVLAFRWADVIRGVARWERVWHGWVVGSWEINIELDLLDILDHSFL